MQALESAGLTPADIRPVYLTPADARAAFERGSVDAWAIWDPYLSAAQDATGGRMLVDGSGLDGHACRPTAMAAISAPEWAPGT